MSYNMPDMELDYENQIKYLEYEVKRLKAKCNRLIRENRGLKGDGGCWILFNSGVKKVFLSYKDAKKAVGFMKKEAREMKKISEKMIEVLSEFSDELRKEIVLVILMICASDGKVSLSEKLWIQKLLF